MSPVDRYDGLIAAVEVRITRLRLLIAQLQPFTTSNQSHMLLEDRLEQLERDLSRLRDERRFALRWASSELK